MATHPMPTTVSRSPAESSHSAMHALGWVVGAIAILPAAIGFWMLAAPEGATITVRIPPLADGTWTAAELADFWAPVLLIAGGIAAAAGFGVAWIIGLRGPQRALPMVALLLTALGVATTGYGVLALL